MSRRSFILLLAALVLVCALQSSAHLWEVLRRSRLDSELDLDRSNGVPDILSTIVVMAGAAGAAAIGSMRLGRSRVVAWALAAVLSLVAIEDSLHLHPGTATTPDLLTVVTAAAGFALFVLLLADDGTRRSRVTLTLGLLAIVGSLVVGELPDIEQWFERARGDPIIEYQIVAKQSLELAGWWLVAMALWDTALRSARVRNRPCDDFWSTLCRSKGEG